MSNYTVTTNFGAKDALPSGNPAKLILGAQLTTEFVNIAAAIASKLDSSSSLVASIAGTANQIAASASTGAVTLSFPANVVVPVAASGVALLVGLSATQSTPQVSVRGFNTTGGNQYEFGHSSASGFGSNIGAETGSGKPFIAFNAEAGTANTYTTRGIAGVVLQTDAAGAFSINRVTAVNTANQSLTSALTMSAAGGISIAAPSSGDAVTINGSSASGSHALTVVAPTAGSRGLIVSAGASGADVCADFNNAANTLTYFRIFGEGSLIAGSPTGGAQGIGTLNATGLFVNGVAVSTGGATTGSFSAGTTGLSAATAACTYTKVGTTVTMFMAVPSSLTSTTTGFTLTGLPAAIQPATAKYATCPGLGLNNSAVANNVTALVSGSSITLGISGTAAAWTASGNKTVGDATHGAVFCWDTT
jgi:hypothetical protein